jgi:hypothetical protein
MGGPGCDVNWGGWGRGTGSGFPCVVQLLLLGGAWACDGEIPHSMWGISVGRLVAMTR